MTKHGGVQYCIGAAIVIGLLVFALFLASRMIS